MSVIAGIVRFAGEPVHAAELAPAAQRFAAPGLSEPTYWAEGQAGLLARQHYYTNEDLAERQPWMGAGGKLVLVYDGRLDNREEIAAALGIHLNGETVPDGALLLAALERWGEQALPKLIGDFALALWNKEKRELLLARDQMGRRTLYYHHGAGFVAFASTYPALLALPGVPGQVDELGMADFLILNTSSPATFYKDVRRIPAAHVATFDVVGMSARRYWSPEPKATLRLASDAEYLEAARELLDRAVACRLRAKDQVAANLSGGLDSSAVASSAALQLAPKRLITLTSVPPEGLTLPKLLPYWYPDERPHVAAIAAMHPNMEPVLASSAAPHAVETDPTPFFEAGGLPARGITNIGWLLPGYERLQQAGIGVLLTGEGGNPAWSYDGLRGLSEMLVGGRWLRFARELYQLGHSRPYSWDRGGILRREVWRQLEPSWLAGGRRRLKGKPREPWFDSSAIHPGFARDIGLAERCRELDFVQNKMGGVSSLEMRLEMLKRMEHGRDIATVLRALTGVEHRAPLLDLRLLEFCLALPEDQFLRNGEFRRLPRRALAGRLPPTVLRNNLIGSQNPELPLRMAMRRPGLSAEIAALRHSPLAARMLDLDRLDQIVRDWNRELKIMFMLPRALHIGRFLRWSGNCSVG